MKLPQRRNCVLTNQDSNRSCGLRIISGGTLRTEVADDIWIVNILPDHDHRVRQNILVLTKNTSKFSCVINSILELVSIECVFFTSSFPSVFTSSFPCSVDLVLFVQELHAPYAKHLQSILELSTAPQDLMCGHKIDQS